MQLNPSGILTVAPAEKRTFLGREYHRVKVLDRPGVPKQLAGKKKVDPLKQGAEEPFALVRTWLEAHRSSTSKKMMSDFQERFPNPYPSQGFRFGALSAIKIQLSLELDRLMTGQPGRDAPAPVTALAAFLGEWETRISVVNSEPAHAFKFLCTECGGFSKMVMGGRDAGQQHALAGDRMMMKGLEALPGPWQNHYAAVLMTDRGDRVSLESAAGMDDWWFGMYGDQRTDQTFIIKTLLTKFEKGEANGEPLSRESSAYVRATLRGDALTASRMGTRLGKLKPIIDGLLRQATDVSDARTPSSETAGDFRPDIDPIPTTFWDSD
ncbi:MAG: hypothetical protein ACRDZ7_18670 [Acidimicrobiia bacterium]